MSNARRKLGQWGENVAAHHLTAEGYEIVARNWRTGRGEIDLIAQTLEVMISRQNLSRS